MSAAPVAVVVTVCQRLDFLPGALASVAAQSLAPAEVCVWDDSASPAIAAICEKAGVMYRANIERRGAALNVRGAVESAAQPLVAILNDDDLWEPDFLARLIPPLLADERRVLSFSDHWLIDADGETDAEGTDRNTRRYGRDRLAAGDEADPAELVLRWNAVPLAMASVFRRDIVPWERLDAEVGGAYDFWISAQLAASGSRFHYTPARLSRYRIHPAMETARLKKAARAEALIYERLVREDAFPAHQALIRRGLAMAWRACGRVAATPAEARHAYARSLAAWPTPGAGVRWLAAFMSSRAAGR